MRLLFDNLVGAGEEHRRNRQAERFCSFEVDHQLELRRLFDGKIGRYCTPQDFINIGGGVTDIVGEIRRVQFCAVWSGLYLQQITRLYRRWLLSLRY